MMNSTSQTGSAFPPASLTSEQDPGYIPAGGVLTLASEEKSEPVQIEESPGEIALATSKDENKTAKDPVKARKKSLWRNRWLIIATRLLMALVIAFTALIMLLTIGPRFLPYQVCSVLSGSMVPTLPVGSVVILSKTDGTELNVGDIITFNYPNHPDQLVTHRIYEIKQGTGGPAFVTKGDANNAPDSWLVNGSGTGWREVFTIPYLGFILAAMGSPLLRILLLGIPAGLFSILLLIEIWSPKPRLVAGN